MAVDEERGKLRKVSVLKPCGIRPPWWTHDSRKSLRLGIAPARPTKSTCRPFLLVSVAEIDEECPSERDYRLRPLLATDISLPAMSGVRPTCSANKHSIHLNNLIFSRYNRRVWRRIIDFSSSPTEDQFRVSHYFNGLVVFVEFVWIRCVYCLTLFLSDLIIGTFSKNTWFDKIRELTRNL